MKPLHTALLHWPELLWLPLKTAQETFLLFCSESIAPTFERLLPIIQVLGLAGRFRENVEVDIGCDQKSGIRDKVLLEKLGTFSVVRKSAHKTHNSNHMLQVLKSVCLVRQLFFSVLQSWSVFKKLSNDQH